MQFLKIISVLFIQILIIIQAEGGMQYLWTAVGTATLLTDAVTIRKGDHGWY